MKTKFLKLSNVCSENWENMQSNTEGNYCELCSKNVIDFTDLSTEEIAEKMKYSKGSVCARVSKEQLNMPIHELRRQRHFKLPFSNVAAGLIIATSLVVGQTANAQDQDVKTEFVPSKSSAENLQNVDKKTVSNKEAITEVATLKGMVISEKTGDPVVNAKITFVTIKKKISVYSSEKGLFSMEIPQDLLSDKNVISIRYSEVRFSNKSVYNKGYERENYILSREEVFSEYSIEAEDLELVFGGISFYDPEYSPLVFINGIEMPYDEYRTAVQIEEEIVSYKVNEAYYFHGKYAEAIGGEKASGGLYLLFDKDTKD